MSGVTEGDMRWENTGERASERGEVHVGAVNSVSRLGVREEEEPLGVRLL